MSFSFSAANQDTNGYKNSEGQYIPLDPRILGDLQRIKIQKFQIEVFKHDNMIQVNNKIKIQIVKCDIVHEQTNAIVVSANRNLDFVSGQAAAIAKAGGSTI